MLDYTSNISSLLVAHPDVADLIERGRRDPESLNPTDWSRFVAFAFLRFGTWEAAFVGYRLRTIDEDLWEAWDGASRYTISGRGYQKFWRAASPAYAKGFRSYQDREIFSSSADSAADGAEA